MKTRIPHQTQIVLPTLKKFKAEMQNLYHSKLDSLILYGSYARGTAKEFSDIDILLVLNQMDSPYQEISSTSEITSNYLFEYDLNISIVPTTLERFNENEVSLYRIIKKEGILL